MAGKSFEFSISCVDKVTATVNRINATVEKMTKPLNDLGKSIDKLGKSSGLSKLGSEFGKAAKAAGRLAKSVAKVAAPMAALVGGGTLAGLYELATGWARLGAETARTAQILGISAQDLDALRNAGQLAGVSAQTMTDGFRAFGDTLQDAKWGRNQAAFATLQFLGIGLKQTKDGAIDTQAALIEFADKVKQVQQRDPAAARRLASTFGVESLLPVLMKGSAAMRAYQAEASRLAGIKTPAMIAHAESFALSLNKMGLAADGLKASIGDKLIPVIQPLIDKWTEWIAANHDLISQKVEEVVSRIAHALGAVDLGKMLDGMGKLVDWCVKLVEDLDDIVRGMGGWKTALEIVGGVIALSFVAPLMMAVTQVGLLATGLASAVATTGGIGLFIASMSFAAFEIYRVVKATNDLMDAKKRLSGEGGVAEAETADTKQRLLGPDGKRIAEMDAADEKKRIERVTGWRERLNLDEKETRYKLPKGLLSAVMMQESAGYGPALSPAGAKGLFQFMPQTEKEYGIDAYNPAQASEAAAKKLAGLFKRYGGNEQLALAAYNWGEGNLANRGVFSMPAETKDYVAKVENYHSIFSKQPVPTGGALPSGGGAEPPIAQDDGGYDRFEDRRRGELAAQAIQVSVQTRVDAQGGVRTRVETPAGVKIGYTSPAMAGS